MRIPTPSDVLVVGVSPVSLAFATILAKEGLNVLAIEESLNPINKSLRKLALSAYSLNLLAQHGYQLTNETTEDDFVEQSLSLLAHSLCCVVWGTRLTQSLGQEHQLTQEDVSQTHQTPLIFKLADLEIDPLNDEANFRNAFVLAWRVIGVSLQKLHPFILHSFDVERQLISNYYTQKTQKNWFAKWTEKLAAPESKELSLKNSPINLHLSQQRDLEAGDLLSDLVFFDEKLKVESSLHQWCSYQYFSMIVIGSLNPHFLFNTAKWVQLNFNIKLFFLPFTERNEHLFKTLNMTPSEKKTLIVRPDKYVCLVNDTLETSIIDNYLRNVLMMIPNAEKIKSH